MDYKDHLDKISHRLKVIENFLSDAECDEIIKLSNNRDYNDRSTFVPNYGLKNDLGNYESVGYIPASYPEEWEKIFAHKLVEGFEPIEVQVNKYEKGHFIPPHKDKGLALYTVSVPLQTDDKNYLLFGDPDAYYDNMSVEESDSLKMTTSFSDVKGRGYLFSGTTPIHWVPPTNSLRYSAIFIYGLPL